MKKYSYLVMVLVVGLVFMSGCKTADDGFDISGTWSISLTVSGQTYVSTVNIQGSNAGGTITTDDTVGNYLVTNNTAISWSWSYTTGQYGRILESYNGTITSDNSMSGSATANYQDLGNSLSGTWTATKI